MSQDIATVDDTCTGLNVKSPAIASIAKQEIGSVAYHADVRDEKQLPAADCQGLVEEGMENGLV